MSRQGLAVLVLVVALSAGFLGCGREYANASEETYRIATALVSVCERKQTDKLALLSDLIASGEATGDVPASEAEYLRAIVQLADDGDWAAAKKEARDVLSHQVEGGP